MRVLCCCRALAEWCVCDIRRAVLERSGRAMRKFIAFGCLCFCIYGSFAWVTACQSYVRLETHPWCRRGLLDIPVVDAILLGALVLALGLWTGRLRPKLVWIRDGDLALYLALAVASASAPALALWTLSLWAGRLSSELARVRDWDLALCLVRAELASIGYQRALAVLPLAGHGLLEFLRPETSSGQGCNTPGIYLAFQHGRRMPSAIKETLS